MNTTNINMSIDETINLVTKFGFQIIKTISDKTIIYKPEFGYTWVAPNGDKAISPADVNGRVKYYQNISEMCNI